MTVTARVYQEASAPCAAETALRREGDAFRVCVPKSARPGDQIHLIFKAQAEGHYRLVHYQQVILSVR